jgi:N-dimethylarginine dimethylaminohydrolase
MKRLLIEPTTFEVLAMQDKQNPYIDIHHEFDRKKVAVQHKALTEAIKKATGIVYRLPETKVHLPDIVFVANGGLSLPRLPKPLVLLPQMKWPQRQAELPFLRAMYRQLGIATIPFPTRQPFEGQAELKWFDGGRKAVGAYGFRSTRQAFRDLEALFQNLYDEPPAVLVLPLQSANYYHLDVAMLEYSDHDQGVVSKCVVHRGAFSPASIKRLKEFLGADNVSVIDTEDSFCLNAFVDGGHLITHKITDPKAKAILEKKTGCRVVEIDTSEFEKSGGSVRCMTLDLY